MEASSSDKPSSMEMKLKRGWFEGFGELNLVWIGLWL